MYADALPKELKQGELHPDFGLLISRHFFIKSKLSSGRYLDAPATGERNFIIKTPNG
jgi:hypothetical protein